MVRFSSSHIISKGVSNLTPPNCHVGQCCLSARGNPVLLDASQIGICAKLPASLTANCAHLSHLSVMDTPRSEQSLDLHMPRWWQAGKQNPHGLGVRFPNDGLRPTNGVELTICFGIVLAPLNDRYAFLDTEEVCVRCPAWEQFPDEEKMYDGCKGKEGQEVGDQRGTC
jgi:hypothetical protein